MLPTHRAIILADPDADKLIIFHNPTGAATFDPAITTSISTTVIWETEVGRTVTNGTTHNLSYTPTAGPKVCKATVVGGLRLVSSIDFTDDAISRVANLPKLASNCAITLTTNAGMELNLTYLPRKAASWKINGIGATVKGSLSDLPDTIITYYGSYNTAITGSLADLKASLETVYLHFSSATAASIAHLINIRDLRMYSIGWNQAGVDTVISSMWAARANYTYATPSLQIGGTNAAPSGSYIAPEEGANWHEDTPGHWVPLTGKAMIYDLINDVNGEGFNIWGISFTS